MTLKCGVSTCLFVSLIVSGIAASRAEEVDIPMVAMRLIAESLLDTCPVCAEQNRKKAYAVIEKGFVPDKEISSTPDCAFIKTEDCGPTEFVSACYASRMPYDGPGGKKGAFPLLVFRFHTAGDHLVGIAFGDYTTEDAASVFNRIGKDSPFDAAVKVIAYRYGDGRSFNYSPKENRLTVHCRVLRVAPRR